MMSQVEATVGRRLPVPVALPAAAGLAVAAAVMALILHPLAGVYVCQAVGLPASLAAAGVAAFRALAAPGAVSGRLAGTVDVLAVVAFAAALVGIGFLVMTVADDTLPGLGDRLSWSVVLRGGDYAAVLARGAGLVAAVLSVRERRAGRAGLLAVAALLLVATTYAVSGHARSHGPAALVVIATIAHVAGAAAWFGGLVGLGVALHRRTAPSGRLLAGFAGVMTGVLTTVLAAGGALAFLYLPSVSALVTTAYGEVLLVKLVLVAAMLAVSATNHLRLVPRAAGGDAAAARLLRATVAVEQVVLLTVLVITAILMRQDPGVAG